MLEGPSCPYEILTIGSPEGIGTGKNGGTISQKTGDRPRFLYATGTVYLIGEEFALEANVRRRVNAFRLDADVEDQDLTIGNSCFSDVID